MASAQRIAAVSARPGLRSQNPRRNGYICLNCQLRALSISRKPLGSCRARNISLTPLRHYAGQRPNSDDDKFEKSFANKVRKRIWGTENPPGQRNPYVREMSEEEEAERVNEEVEREAIKKEEEDLLKIRRGEEEDDVVVAGEQEVVDDVAEEEDEEEENEKIAGEPQRQPLKEYEPAKTWRGLRFIPGWKVAEQKRKPWFEGFLAPKKIETTDGIERAIQRALVEVWTMKQELGTTRLPAKIDNPTDDFEERLATGATFNGDMSLTFEDVTLQEHVLQSLGLRETEDNVAEKEQEKLDHVSEDALKGERFGKGGRYQEEISEPAMENEEVEDLATEPTEDVIAIGEYEDMTEGIDTPPLPVDQSYQQVTLQDPDLKFAVLKRVMQLTGTRIPDPAIPRLNTAASLLQHLTKPPPPKHLADDLLENTVLQGFPNVQISPKRLTMVAKETEIGRWKLIEAELAQRGLPSEAELAAMEKDRGTVDDHVLPYIKQSEKKLRRR